MNVRMILLDCINAVLKKKGKPQIQELDERVSLRLDLGFDSLDLAELTVRLEDKTGIDIFAQGPVDTISEILRRLSDGHTDR